MNLLLWTACGAWALSCLAILRFFAVATAGEAEGDPALIEGRVRRHLTVIDGSRLAS